MPLYWLTRSVTNKGKTREYYFERNHGKTTHISHDKFVLATSAPLSHTVRIKCGWPASCAQSKYSYFVSNSPTDDEEMFYSNVGDSFFSLQQVNGMIDRYLNTYSGNIADGYVFTHFPSVSTVLNVPIYKKYGYMVTKTSSTSETKCFNDTELNAGIKIAALSHPKSDAYKACMGDDCKYVVLVVDNGSDDGAKKNAARLGVIKKLAGLTPKFHKHWPCKKKEELGYYLFDRVEDNVGQLIATDFEKFKAKAKALIEKVHKRHVSMGGNVKTTDFVYRKVANNDYELLVWNITSSIDHDADSGLALAGANHSLTEGVAADAAELGKL